MSKSKVKQINNLVIRYSPIYEYCVYAPDDRCLEDRMTLEQAEEYCRQTTDFCKRRPK